MIKKGKVIGLVLLGIIGLSSVSAHADRNLKMGDKALSFSIAEEDFVIGGRYFVNPNLAALAEFGFQAVSNGNSGTDFTIGGGVRQYLAKSSDLHPFVQGTFVFVSDFNSFSDSTENGVEINAGVGLEYFVAKQLSVEAVVGMGLKTISDGEDVTTFGSAQSQPQPRHSAVSPQKVRTCIPLCKEHSYL